MQMFLEVVLLLLTVVVLTPVAMFCTEVLCSLWPYRRRLEYHVPDDARIAVLIPAHNEEAVIARTLETLMPSVGQGGRVLVVADNCSDSTAETARRLGADVVERFDRERRGKGFALDHGLKALAGDPPDVVVFLDADCQADPQLVGRLAAAALETGRPVQGLNLCDPDPAGGPMQAVSGLAFRFKNLVRMLGLSRLAGLNYLTGTGMALPWKLATTHSIAGGNVVEDMQWGIDLALNGHRPLFVPEAAVRSPLPQQRSAAKTQRTRWEHGHLKTLLSQVPQLLWLALTRRRLDLLLLAFDLAIPPLSLLVLILMLAITSASAFALTGLASWNAAIALAFGALCVVAAVAAGWCRHCRKAIPASALCMAPLYAVAKLPIYLTFVWKRQREWIRTEREASAPVVR